MLNSNKQKQLVKDKQTTSVKIANIVDLLMFLVPFKDVFPGLQKILTLVLALALISASMRGGT